MTSVLEFTLHLVFVNLDPVFVSLHSPLVLGLHLCGLCLCELNLLLHEGTILLEVDVLVVQFIFALVKLALELIVLLSDFNALHFELLLLLVEDLLLLTYKVSLRLNLVLKSNLLAFELG